MKWIAKFALTFINMFYLCVFSFAKEIVPSSAQNAILVSVLLGSKASKLNTSTLLKGRVAG